MRLLKFQQRSGQLPDLRHLLFIEIQAPRKILPFGIAYQKICHTLRQIIGVLDPLTKSAQHRFLKQCFQLPTVRPKPSVLCETAPSVISDHTDLILAPPEISGYHWTGSRHRDPGLLLSIPAHFSDQPWEFAACIAQCLFSRMFLDRAQPVFLQHSTIATGLVAKFVHISFGDDILKYPVPEPHRLHGGKTLISLLIHHDLPPAAAGGGTRSCHTGKVLVQLQYDCFLTHLTSPPRT